MTKAEMIEFLAPFTDDVELRIWDGSVWKRVAAKAEYSNRSGRTTVYLVPQNENGYPEMLDRANHE